MDRKRRLMLNTVSALLLQGITFICGFILPRLILQQYGSEVNGLVQSINQFLNIITFLELGIGAVIQSSLYKPLADRDFIKVSEIVTSGQRFFNRIAAILCVYVCLLVFFYPLIVSDSFDWLYTATLILAISVSSFAQYYYGLVDKLFLNSDQRGYIQYVSQIITVLTSTILSVILIQINASIHVVKLATSLVYLVRPLVVRVYINKRYQINRKITYTGEPIKQKWNGVAQHVAAIVLDNTDAIVLTLFSALSNVSIYSIYQMIVFGVKSLFISVTSGVQALLGDMIARNEGKAIDNFFEKFELFVHFATTVLFVSMAVLIVPFVKIYTEGITDVNYDQPLFGMLLVLANGMHCLRIPYNIVIMAGGHYRQTQSNYIVAASMNIIISILAVKNYGLIGVAIGTMVAMAYQTVWMARYISKHIIRWPFRRFVKHCLVDMASIGASILCVMLLKANAVSSYFQWALYAVCVCLSVSGIVTIVHLIAFPKVSSAIVGKFNRKGK